METVESIFYVEPAWRPRRFAAEWIIAMSACPIIELRRSNPMKKLSIAAAAFSALAVFTAAHASACALRKTGFSEFHEFDDLTVEGNNMSDTYTALSKITRCLPVSQTITSTRLGVNCHVGGLSLDTEQLTVQCTSISRSNPKTHNSVSVSRRLALNTNEVTVQSAITSEVGEQPNNSTSSDRSEFGTSTIGTDEGTQLKARLA